MTYEGLATLLLRLAGVAMLFMQVVGSIGTAMALSAAPVAPPMGAVFTGAAVYAAGAALVIALSRSIARLLAAGL
jgi:hypothetical protein